MTYYHTLGVSIDASQEEIKKAYRKLVKQYHPDVNASPEAEVKIRQIREAYDVLIDPYRRSFYNLSLETGQPYQPMKGEPVFNEREKKKREYQRRKAKKDRENFERLVHLRVSFYRFQRRTSYLFLLIAILFSIDYHLQLDTQRITVEKIRKNHYGDAYVRINQRTVPTDVEMYNLYDGKDHQVKIYYSSILHLPSILEYKGQAFKVKSNLYIFNNAFSYIIIAIAIILIGEKRYHDWLLTIGLVPFFFIIILIFLLLFDLNGVSY